jgi:gas vesicle protein
MKAATVKQLKEALNTCSQKELIEICLRLSKFKKENKELLTYLLYESRDEESYIRSVKSEIESQFEQINRRSFYFIKKSIRKILRNLKKYIRYSQNKETEVELLLHFCRQLKAFNPSIKKSRILKNLYSRQLEAIRKAVAKLHEDLQFDYSEELEELEEL